MIPGRSICLCHSPQPTSASIAGANSRADDHGDHLADRIGGDETIVSDPGRFSEYGGCFHPGAFV